jgi:thiamine biosynthesis lipoprotein
MALGPALHPKGHHPGPQVLEQVIVPAGMASKTFHAMGTTIQLLLPIAQAVEGTRAVQQLFEEWEQTLSRFRADSELMQLNRQAGQAVIVSPLLFQVLQTALIAARETDGLYDPTLFYQLHQIGYDRSFDEVAPRQAEPGQEARAAGGWRQIELCPHLRSVTLPEGSGLDFGGIAKGMAVDAALALLQSRSIETALVNAGGDLAVTGLPAGYTSWPIAIQGKDTTWLIPFHHGALATSSVARRHWRQGTRERHHLLDPRTGESLVGPLWSVTIAAARCVQAEIATKATFLLGPEEGTHFLQRYGLAGLLVQHDGSWTTAGNWPVEAMQSLKDI